MADSSIEPAKRPYEALSNLEKSLSKKPKSEDASKVVERRRLDKEQKEAERRLLREQKESERKAAKEKKEAERLAEKMQKELERKADKERKEVEKLAEKAKKEAEKQLEKLRKEAEKAAEKDKRDADKLAAKEKKEMELFKAQPKINLFFKASPSSAPSSQLPEPVPDIQALAQNINDTCSDYQRYILPFHVKQNGQLYSGICNYICTDEAEFTMDCRDWLKRQSPKTSTQEVCSKSPSNNKITSQQFQTQLALAQESSQVANLLTHIRMRRLQFSHLSPKYIEDPSAPLNQEYRPPYIGSIRDLDEERLKTLAVNPFRTDLINEISYEYDSEVEWDNEEGEDLRDDDGDDSDEDQEYQEELREFLSSDDDDSSSPKKPRFLGPLNPIVIWGNDELSPGLDSFAIQLFNGPIVPHKGVVDVSADKTSNKLEAGSQIDEANSSPVPLSSMLGHLEMKVGRDKLRRSLISHNGSTGTKTLIVELLKQQLSGATAQEIKTLFDNCVERVGKKRAEKKWVLNSKACEYFSFPSSEIASLPGHDAMPLLHTQGNASSNEASEMSI